MTACEVQKFCSTGKKTAFSHITADGNETATFFNVTCWLLAR